MSYTTVFQVSSGGVIYRRRDDRIEVALAARDGGRIWCLPKGLVEKPEMPEATAAREVREETGLTGELEGKLGDISYWYVSKAEPKRFHKTVHFYLFRYVSGRPEDHDWEVDEVRWFPINQAVRVMTYKSEREIMAKAAERLGAG